jgi:hypothetical protein
MIICNSFILYIFYLINIPSFYMLQIENVILCIKRDLQTFPIFTLEEKTKIYQAIMNEFPPDSYYVDCPPYDVYVDSMHLSPLSSTMANGNKKPV